MADAEILALVKEYASALRHSGMPVESLVLYGSMARGDAREWSDIDVLAIVSDSVPQSELLDLNCDIQFIGKKIDLRFEVIAVYASQYESDNGSVLVHEARNEGIRVAA